MAERELNWDDLRYFLAASRAGTFSGASRAMKVEHTTIGRRLSSLEDTLGAPLMLRGPEGLRLTSVGEAIVPLVEAVERAVLGVREAVSARRLRVRLAVPSSGFTTVLTPRIAELQKALPKLSLELVSSTRFVDLQRGEADLAIRSGPVLEKELVVRRLGEVGWALYASQAYLARRGAPEDSGRLAGHDLIGYDRSLASVPAAKWLEDHAEGANIVMRSREATDLLAAALSGAGIAALPCIVGDAEPKLRRISAHVIATRPISLVYRREAKLSREVRAVIRMVLEVMHEHAQRFRGSPR